MEGKAAGPRLFALSNELAFSGGRFSRIHVGAIVSA